MPALEDRLQIWDAFLTRWPKEKLSTLTLDEYTDVNNQDTFTYWLEHKTKALGSIRGGDSSKFGIYRRNKAPKGERTHIQHGEQYSWNTRFGNSAPEAFNNIKTNILRVIALVGKGDLNSLQALPLADTLKWKIAFLYQDQANPIVINIFKRNMLRKACADSNEDFAELYRKIMVNRGSKNVVEYGFELWSELDADALENDNYNDDEDITGSSAINNSLNTILYGPPGTGKTYSTINKALEIVDAEFYQAHSDDRVKLKQRFDELVKSNRIGFVTFHQSFSYEDFVEGIKATTSENNQVSYDVEDGIFKQMCDAASAKITIATANSTIDISGKQIWKMSLGNTLGDDAYIYEDCLKNNAIALGYGELIDFTGASNRKEISALYRKNGRDIKNESNDYNVTSIHYFKNNISKGDIVIVSDGNHKFRAIAEVTSDYYFEENEAGDYCQLRKVKWLREFKPSLPVNEIFNKNLSQQTIYRLKPPTIDLDKLQSILTDNDGHISIGSMISNYKILSISNEIIELEKPNGSTLPIAMSIINELVKLVKANEISIDDIRNKQIFDKVETKLEKYLINGYPNVFAPLIEAVIQKGIATNVHNTTNKRVLIIDEINRGNIANIFGELITLIEPSKRAGGNETITVRLPYSKMPFSVPSNLYIIGTMNTADKSLAQVDIALRRRFEFIEMMTDYDVLELIPRIAGINIRQLVETINQRIELLYDREHTIGHSFFLPLKTSATIENLANIFELQILPLLEEYFFEDWERVGQVLGDHLKANDALRFIVEKFQPAKISQLMGNDWELSGIQPYIRNAQALANPLAYIGIYETVN